MVQALRISDLGLRIEVHCGLRHRRLPIGERDMKPEQLRQRTKEFGLGVIRLVETLPHSQTADMVSRQLLRAATAVGANYRAACRARSLADFVSKIGVVEEEVDEARYWLEILQAEKLASDGERMRVLLLEAEELTAIFAASGRTARRGPRRILNRQPTITNPQSPAIHNRQSTIRNLTLENYREVVPS